MEFLSYRIELFDITVGVAIAELVVTLIAWFGVWYVIRRRERLRAARGLSSNSGLRLVLAAAAMLTMLFSGGCSSLLLAYLAGRSWDEMSLIGPAIPVVGGVPFAIGLLVWWLAMRRKMG